MKKSKLIEQFFNHVLVSYSNKLEGLWMLYDEGLIDDKKLIESLRTISVWYEVQFEWYFERLRTDKEQKEFNEEIKKIKQG